MQCELCGNECGDHCRLAQIDNVKMMLCPQCIRHGEGVKQIHTGSSSHVQHSLRRRSKRKKEKDVYENMDIELISEWAVVIKKGRQKNGLTREQLGFKIGEPTNVISKIENGELRPSDKAAKKLEKELNISLFEEVKQVKPASESKGSQGLTLADFIKKQ